LIVNLIASVAAQKNSYNDRILMRKSPAGMLLGWPFPFDAGFSCMLPQHGLVLVSDFIPLDRL
jgi:hypothetical protein